MAYLFISHDLKVVRALCEDIIVMKMGKVVESGNTEEIFNNPEEQYTKALLKAAIEIVPDQTDDIDTEASRFAEIRVI